MKNKKVGKFIKCFAIGLAVAVLLFVFFSLTGFRPKFQSAEPKTLAEIITLLKNHPFIVALFFLFGGLIFGSTIYMYFFKKGESE